MITNLESLKDLIKGHIYWAQPIEENSIRKMEYYRAYTQEGKNLPDLKCSCCRETIDIETTGAIIIGTYSSEVAGEFVHPECLLLYQIAHV